MDEDDGNHFVRFKTTNRNTTTKERYLALTTDEIQLIRFMVGEMSPVLNKYNMKIALTRQYHIQYTSSVYSTI